MARFLTQNLPLRRSLRLLPPTLTQFRRAESTRSGKGHLFEMELTPSATSSEKLMIKAFDEIFQTIMIQRATPDWLPFVPGGSFWVPPRPSNIGVDFVQKMAHKISDEESLSMATDRGWPCSQYLINDRVPAEIWEVDEGAEEPDEDEDVKVIEFEDE